MAIDSLAKRESALLDVMVTPDGAFDIGDRWSMLGQYSGVAAEATVTPFDWYIGPVDLMRVRYGRREGWWCTYDGVQMDIDPDPEPEIVVAFPVCTPIIVPWRAEGY